MHVPDVELHDGVSLQQATELMARYGPRARYLAGGTDVLVDLKSGRISVEHLIAIGALPELMGVQLTDAGLRIGAMTTITQLGGHPLIHEHFPSLLDATTRMAAPQIRNVATVGGNIASAVPCADMPPLMMVLNGAVELQASAGPRSVPLDAFFIGPRQTAIGSDEILAAVVLPLPPPRFGAAYARFGLREGNAIAVAAVAASLVLRGDGTIDQARMVLGAVAPVPKLVSAAGKLLTGCQPATDAFKNAASAAMNAAEPIADVRGSAEYRRELVGVLAQRALESACRRAQETIP